jgi:hypothetical protein
LEKLDILNREEFVNKLVNLTENISANRTSTSFAINGAWGCGKSFVLDMYEERLSEIQSEETATDKYFVIRYNCWKYDYYDEPLVAIVAAMIDFINQKTKLWNDEQKKARILGVLKLVGTTLLSMANDGIKDKIGVDIKATYETLKTNIKAEEEKVEQSHEYDVYFSFNQALRRLQDLIAELSEEQTVVFMVDELDRCLPEYSIKVLERLHHLNENSNNVITVLSMDKEQLQTSVKQIFGFDNPGKYLEKFIQFEIKLDYGNVSEQVTEKYYDYIAMFDKDIFQIDDSIEEFIQAIFKDVDVRTQEQVVKRAMVAHQLLYNDKKDYVFMCMELLLTVLICVYNDDSCFLDNPLKFGQGDNRFNNFFVPHSTSPTPAFADFFNKKWNDIQFLYESGFPDEGTKYVLPKYSKLYCAIIYNWYWMHKRNKSIAFAHYRGDEYETISNHHKELKTFAETIKMIK